MQWRRVVGHLWASPLTVLGVAQALAGGARPHSVADGGVLQFVAGRRGPIRWFVRRARVSAYTWGAVVTYASHAGPADPVLVAHERAHVHQAMRWGPLMPIAYVASSLWHWARGGRPYFDNFFERDARAREGGP
jgi:hypothetical protein